MSTLQVRNVVSPDGGVPDNLLPVTASAWAKWDGTTSTILGGENVSSVTDNAVGQSILNFAASLPSDDYSVVVSSIARSAATNCDTAINDTVQYDSSGVCVVTITGGASTDVDVVTAVVFGGQA